MGSRADLEADFANSRLFRPNCGVHIFGDAPLFSNYWWALPSYRHPVQMHSRLGKYMFSFQANLEYIYYQPPFIAFSLTILSKLGRNDRQSAAYIHGSLVL